METSPLSPQLSQLISEFEAATERVAKMQREYTEEEWQRKPGPERWSAIECVWHLNRSSKEMLPRIRESMVGLAGKPKYHDNYHLDFIGWFLVKGLASKGRFAKFKTPNSFVPKQELNVQNVLDRFQSLQREMILAIHDANGLPLGNGRVQSAFNARVNYSTYSAFHILAVHEHRHLDQAERAAMGK
jgi:DinB superfamily